MSFAFPRVSGENVPDHLAHADADFCTLYEPLLGDVDEALSLVGADCWAVGSVLHGTDDIHMFYNAYLTSSADNVGEEFRNWAIEYPRELLRSAREVHIWMFGAKSNPWKAVVANDGDVPVRLFMSSARTKAQALARRTRTLRARHVAQGSFPRTTRSLVSLRDRSWKTDTVTFEV